jgi:hypothetical protein
MNSENSALIHTQVNTDVEEVGATLSDTDSE